MAHYSNMANLDRLLSREETDKRNVKPIDEPNPNQDSADDNAGRNGPWGIPSLLPIRIGTPNNGGAVTTAGGITFIAATSDNKVRAIETATGKVLWQETCQLAARPTR